MAEQVTISDLELAESLLNDMVIPVETATKTYSVTLKTLKKFIGTSLPLGCIVQNVGVTDDERLTLLDGKILSRSGTYKDFCDKVVEYVANGKWKQCTENEFSQDVNTYGQCGKFVITTDYVRIPKITRFLGATITLSEIGASYAGEVPAVNINVQSGTGTTIKALANNTSSVQQTHIKYPYYMIVSSEGQVEPISVDINQVMEDLNAINESCLHKKGNEEFSGYKTALDTRKYRGNGWETAPSSGTTYRATYKEIDGSNTIIAENYTGKGSNGSVVRLFRAIQNTGNNKGTYGGIRLDLAQDGAFNLSYELKEETPSAHTYIPDTGLYIPTMDKVNSRISAKIQKVSALPSNPTSTVLYCIQE